MNEYLLFYQKKKLIGTYPINKKNLYFNYL